MFCYKNGPYLTHLISPIRWKEALTVRTATPCLCRADGAGLHLALVRCPHVGVQVVRRHEGLAADVAAVRAHLLVGLAHVPRQVSHLGAGLEKTRFKKKNPTQCFFCFFLGFFLVFLYMCLEERVFRVFSVSRIL
jgi:hypothetical protein